jgi:hypothetical protein
MECLRLEMVEEWIWGKGKNSKESLGHVERRISREK